MQAMEEFVREAPRYSTVRKDQNQRKGDILNKMQHLQERIRDEEDNNIVQRLVSLLESLKALEQQESELKSHNDAKCSELLDDIGELEKKKSSGDHKKSLSDDFDDSLQYCVKRLHSAKTELAAKLREIVLLKRQLDAVPSQGELIQYERRFSELYIHIQDKLRQTRIYYATFNALLEIKDLMLKETSLLNSISTQFQDAITSTGGGKKLVDSIEGIVKGTQQKLEKVEIVLQAEQRACDTLKQRRAAAVAEQRHCYSLLKAFQEECAKNERLRSKTSDIHPFMNDHVVPRIT